jgi:hypothetical protein
MTAAVAAGQSQPRLYQPRSAATPTHVDRRGPRPYEYEGKAWL